MRLFSQRITFFPIAVIDKEFCTAHKLCQALLILPTYQNTTISYKIIYSRLLQVKWDIAFDLSVFECPWGTDLLYIHNFQKQSLNLIQFSP